MYEIENSIPIPPKKGKGILSKLEVNESTVIPLDRLRIIRTIASRLKREKGKEFVFRGTEDKTIRVWRVK